MPCYFIAQIQIHDKDVYQNYLDNAEAVFSQFDGQYLAIDDHPILLEGLMPCARMVIIQFPSQAALTRWYESAAYQRILKYRLSAAVCNTLMVHGLDD